MAWSQNRLAHHGNFLEDLCSFIHLALLLLQLRQLLGQAGALYLHKDLQTSPLLMSKEELLSTGWIKQAGGPCCGSHGDTRGGINYCGSHA